MAETQKLTPEVFRICELLEKNLKIPNFQRPYEWEKERVEQFIKDLEEVFRKEYLEKGKQEHFEYLIGNMVLHENSNGEYEIVDGQQRIVSLGIILYVLNKNEDNNFLKLNLQENSFKTVKENFEVIENFLKNYNEKSSFKEFLQKNLIVNVLITKDLDFAFFLFDAHNTRGKPLDRKDLLKVHHIRLIKKEDLKVGLAKKWEEYEKENIHRPIDKLKQILQILSVARRGIRGELKGEDLIEIDVYKEFLSEAEGYNLNNYNQPPIFEDFEYFPEEDVLRLKLKRLSNNLCFGEIKEGKKYLPFEIPQSIEGGERFFYFIIKYYHLVKELEEKHKNIFCLFDNISGSGNRFINEVYKSLILLYYDKFESNLLEEFAIRLIIIFSHLRINQGKIKRETPINKYAKPEADDINLYKAVFLSYSPNIVVKKLNDYIRFNTRDITIPESETKREFINAWLNSNLKEKIRETLKELGKKWEEDKNEK